MKRTTLTASLVGSAAAGLIAAAIATPAWAQATTYPEGTDCSAISNSSSRQDCMQQQNESRQVPAPGSVAPSPDGTGTVRQGSGATDGNPSPLNPGATGGAAQSPNTSGSGNPSTGTPGGGTGTGTSNP